jgi:hypothetical protein
MKGIHGVPATTCHDDLDLGRGRRVWELVDRARHCCGRLLVSFDGVSTVHCAGNLLRDWRWAGQKRLNERGSTRLARAVLMFTKPRLEWEPYRMYQATCEVQIRLISPFLSATVCTSRQIATNEPIYLSIHARYYSPSTIPGLGPKLASPFCPPHFVLVRPSTREIAESTMKMESGDTIPYHTIPYHTCRAFSPLTSPNPTACH